MDLASSLALIVSAPWFWWRLGSLLPDQTNAYLIVIAAIACVIWLQERRGAWLGLAVVFLTAATLTKLEGAVFGSILVAATLVAGFAKYRRAATPACILLLGPAALVLWHFWLSQHQVATSTPDYNAPRLTSPSFLAHRIHRLTHAIDHMLRAPFQTKQITAVIILLAIGVLLAVASGCR